MASQKQRKAKKHTQSNKNSNLAQDQVSYLFRHFPSLIRITNLFSYRRTKLRNVHATPTFID